MTYRLLAKFLPITLLFLLSFFLLFSHIQAQNAQPQSVGQVVWIKGTVKAAAPNQAPRNLQRRSPIYTHDTITTDKTSTGQIVFTDNSLVALKEDTELRIDDYKFGNNVPPNKSKYVASLVKGGFRTITGLIPKNNSANYQVNTPVATIGVSASGYDVNYQPITEVTTAGITAGTYTSPGELTLGYLEGHPFFTNNSGTFNLDPQQHKFAIVSDVNGTPTFTTIQPTVLNNMPTIVITTFTAQTGGNTTKNTGGGGGTCTSKGSVITLVPAT